MKKAYFSNSMYAIHREGFLELCPVFIICVQMPCALALSSWNLAFEKGKERE